MSLVVGAQQVLRAISAQSAQQENSAAVQISIARAKLIHSMADEIQIMVNGENRNVALGATVADLLASLALPPGRVAIERNLEILPRPQWAETRLAPDDRYEIVQFVGGG